MKVWKSSGIKRSRAGLPVTGALNASKPIQQPHLCMKQPIQNAPAKPPIPVRQLAPQQAVSAAPAPETALTAVSPLRTQSPAAAAVVNHSASISQPAWKQKRSPVSASDEVVTGKTAPVRQPPLLDQQQLRQQQVVMVAGPQRAGGQQQQRVAVNTPCPRLAVSPGKASLKRNTSSADAKVAQRHCTPDPLISPAPSSILGKRQKLNHSYLGTSTTTVMKQQCHSEDPDADALEKQQALAQLVAHAARSEAISNKQMQSNKGGTIPNKGCLWNLAKSVMGNMAQRLQHDQTAAQNPSGPKATATMTEPLQSNAASSCRDPGESQQLSAHPGQHSNTQHAEHIMGEPTVRIAQSHGQGHRQDPRPSAQHPVPVHAASNARNSLSGFPIQRSPTAAADQGQGHVSRPVTVQPLPQQHIRRLHTTAQHQPQIASAAGLSTTSAVDLPDQVHRESLVGGCKTAMVRDAVSAAVGFKTSCCTCAASCGLRDVCLHCQTEHLHLMLHAENISFDSIVRSEVLLSFCACFFNPCFENIYYADSFSCIMVTPSVACLSQTLCLLPMCR